MPDTRLSCPPRFSLSALFSTPDRIHATVRGYILAEALLCLAIVAMAALPLALLATRGISAAGQQRAMSGITRVVAEAAEAGIESAGRASSAIGVRIEHCGALRADASCVPGTRLAVGGSTSPTAMLPRVALWVSP
ncbi:hypothetical protein [Cupriavidus pampae]|uniref:Type II secretion system protein n=1 Tax=Cupriavidus pampae TaxID=659251 RepID=A0ABN7Y827_9BURK|nr:hypothetical protein [Cupriavidus pampae]CAG9169513.1 hypothetical protein LMG32289_01707 [Cupriavidus pampae]